MTESKSHGVPFHAHTQLEFIEASPGRARVRAPDLPELKNHLGTLHGGMLFTIGEVAAAVAVTQMLGEDLARATIRAITRRGSIEYLKPARGAITASSQVSMTREEIAAALETQASIDLPIAVTLTDEAGLTVATLKVEWFVGRPKNQT